MWYDNFSSACLQIVYEMGFNMSVSEFSAKIRVDPENFYNSENETVEAFRDIISNVITKKVLSKLFKELPVTELKWVGLCDALEQLCISEKNKINRMTHVFCPSEGLMLTTESRLLTTLKVRWIKVDQACSMWELKTLHLSSSMTHCH